MLARRHEYQNPIRSVNEMKHMGGEHSLPRIENFIFRQADFQLRSLGRELDFHPRE
jgi:hypothetical protein